MSAAQAVGGSGPEGRIRAQDVQAFVESGAPASAPAATAPAPAAAAPGIEAFQDIPLSNMRSVSGHWWLSEQLIWGCAFLAFALRQMASLRSFSTPCPPFEQPAKKQIYVIAASSKQFLPRDQRTERDITIWKP